MSATPLDMLHSLTATAVLGTARHADFAVPREGRIGALCGALPAEDAESRLLGAAGVLATVVLAGARPAVAVPPSPPTAADEPPAKGVQAGSPLRHVLESGHWLLLKDWCRATTHRGACASAEILPALLTALRARLSEVAGTPMLEVMGPRGRWLARQNPHWAPLVADFDELSAAWELASGVERIRLFAAMRRLDAARAREALAKALAAEDADTRTELISALGAGLSSTDEPFLEAALGDASKVARRAAASLLAALPESRYCARMAERVRQLVQTSQTGGLVRKKRTKIEVTLPESSKDLVREGLEDKKLEKLGNKAWMLAQVIAATPLTFWSTLAELDPAGWIDASAGNEWHCPLLLGWTIAAGRQSDPAWSAALLSRLVAESPDVPIEVFDARVGPLVAALTPAAREGALTDPLARRPRALTPTMLWPALLACEHAWSPAFSRMALAAVARHVNAIGSDWDPNLRPADAAAIAVGTDPAAALEFCATMTAAERLAPATQRWVDELTGLIRLRQEYL